MQCVTSCLVGPQSTFSLSRSPTLECMNSTQGNAAFFQARSLGQGDATGASICETMLILLHLPLYLNIAKLGRHLYARAMRYLMGGLPLRVPTGTFCGAGEGWDNNFEIKIHIPYNLFI